VRTLAAVQRRPCFCAACVRRHVVSSSRSDARLMSNPCHESLALFVPADAVSLDLWKVATKYMFGRACIAECIQWDSRKRTKVHLVPRPGGAAARGAEGEPAALSPCSLRVELRC
jgi:hypothetical protein